MKVAKLVSYVLMTSASVGQAFTRRDYWKLTELRA